MKEKDLIDLEFYKQTVTPFQSGDTGYYYYTFDFFKKYNGLCLITNSSDETEDGEWRVYLLDENRIVFHSKKDLKKFIELIKNNKVE
jgi:hypothetical protein